MSKQTGRRRDLVPIVATAALLLVYGAVIVVRGPASGHELFPVFKWELFSKVPPREQTSYGVRLLEVDGEVLDEPIYFEKASHLFRSTRSPDVPTLVRRWSQQVAAGNFEESIRSQMVFEARFLESRDVRYQLVRRTYDIVERVECGCFLSEEVIFESSDA